MKVVTGAGALIDLGTTETAPTISIVDYSRRVTDDFGVTTVVKRGFARRLSVRMSLPFEDVDAIQTDLAALRASPALWVADERFAWLQVEGFYKDFELDLAIPPTSYCRLTVEGVAETEVVADTGGDPAPPGQVSTLRLVQPEGPVLVSSSVPEDDYPEWQAGTTYLAQARVIKVATHRVYESVIEDNVGNDPAATFDKWIDLGPTNRWAMFDQSLGTATTAEASIAVTLTARSSVSLLDVVGSTVRVQAAGYDRTEAVVGGAVSFLDLPQAVGDVTVTATGTGSVSIGTVVTGPIADLGVTEAAPTAGITDYSRKVVDDFGEVTVVERAWAKRMNARAIIQTEEIDRVANRLAAVRGVPSLWIGQAGLETLTIYGFFKEFSIEVGESISKLTLSIEGLSTAGKVEPLRAAVADDVTNVGGVPAATIVSDRLVVADTLITQSINSYEQRRRVVAQLYLNGIPVRAIAQILTEARVDENGNAFARAGLEVDANGVIGGIFITSDGELAELKVAADRFLLLRPGTDGSDPADVLLSVEGSKTVLHDVEVDTIKIGTVTPVEMVDGATGEACWSYDDGAVQVSSQTAWQDIDSITITPRHGKPVMVAFTAFAQNISDNSTDIRYRVVRDDGTPVYGTASGRLVQVKSKGEPVILRAVDGSTMDRPTTYTWQGKKDSSNNAVEFNDRIATVEEQARMLFQTFDVATSNAAEGPTAGSGGGGDVEPYDPNPWPYRKTYPVETP